MATLPSRTHTQWRSPAVGALKQSLIAGVCLAGARRDLGAPKMPFVIGVMGVGGLSADQDTVEFRRAMAAPAALPEFAGNVLAVETAPFWSEELGAIDRKREQVSQMGRAFAEANLQMLRSPQEP